MDPGARHNRFGPAPKSAPARKEVDIQEVQRDERRGAFRRPQTQAHRLSLAVRTANGEELPGAFNDLTIRGASARFVINTKQLVVGQSVVLVIGSITRTTKVIVNARVAFCVDSPGGRLCGFQFTDHAGLMMQLDSFYGRFFNRRRMPRVAAPLDRKIPVFLFLTGNEMKAELLDLSVDGMQVRTTRAQVKELHDANHTFVRLRLPGQKDDLRGRAAILRRTQIRDEVTLGLSFDLLQENGFASHRAALQAWVDQRAEEIAKWDTALVRNETPGSKPEGGAKKPDAA